ncbi:MAG TPA: TetR/AcrR family transcriptional regulator [Arachnia sp.]|nr:TetR/AcrR family transcriptional regulator [Arachnia sp.]HMT85377.1 TetR/AcrR family transcriptional regulator [Arachnia sp.]
MAPTRSERHAVSRRDIVDAAWALSRERGLGGWSLRDLAARVGMRAPSLYVYFDSKHAIFDTMFAEAYGQLLDAADAVATPPDAREALREIGRSFFAFAVADIARIQLMFWRVVPGFEPSPESYAVSQKVSEFLVRALQRVGIDDPDAPEVWMALAIGLVTQQVANDPTGTAWGRQVDVVVDMFADRYLGP